MRRPTIIKGLFEIARTLEITLADPTKTSEVRVNGINKFLLSIYARRVYWNTVLQREEIEPSYSFFFIPTTAY
jgi:hypothetical protein